MKKHKLFLTIQEFSEKNIEFLFNHECIAIDKDGNIKNMYYSKKSFDIGNCHGRISAITSDNNDILSIAMPLMRHSDEYEIISVEKLLFYKRVYEKYCQ